MSPPHDTSKNTPKPDSVAACTAQERLARDRRQAQHAAKALEQALHDLGLPEDLVAEIEGRLRSQHKLLGKIIGVMCPPLFGCRTNTELCRVRGWDKNLPPACSGRCPNAPGSSASAAWVWRCWSRYGVTPPAKVRPHAAAGSGPG